MRLPEGWEQVPLESLCKIQSGKSDTQDAVPDGPYAFFDRSKTVKRSARYLRDCEALIIPGEGTEFLPRHFIGKFDLHQRAYALFDFSSRLDVKCLYYYLHHVADYFPGVAVGATVKSLRLRHFEQLPVVLPPIPEQRRIVAILDEAFEAIATAKANTERNVQNAREVFESQRTVIFADGRSHWPQRSIGEIADVQSGGTPLVSRNDFWGGNIAWYSSGELNNLYTSAPLRHITKEGLNGSNAKLFPSGSLLVGMYDTAALKMSLLDRPATFNQAIAGVKPNSAFETEFVMHAINVERDKILSLRRGVRQKNLSLGKIKAITVPVPQVAKQRAVMQTLAIAKALTDHLEDASHRKLSALSELKQSLLHQAFTGALTAKSADRQLEAVA